MNHLSNMISNMTVGSRAKHLNVRARNTKINIGVLSCLYKLGYIRGFSINDRIKLTIHLKYYKTFPVIRNINVISTPGRRVYIKAADLKKFFKRKDSGLYILTTSKGLMCDQEAVLLGIGGELLLKIS